MTLPFFRLTVYFLWFNKEKTGGVYFVNNQAYMQCFLFDYI